MLLENLFPTGQYGDGGRAFMVKTGAGPYVAFATLSGSTWSLTAAGIAALASPSSNVYPDGLPLVGTAGTNVTAVEHGGDGLVRRTVLTMNAVAQAIVNTTAEYASSLIYTFPQGRILLLGAMVSAAQTTTTTIATSIASGTTGAFALGSAAASATSLTGAMVDMLPSTSYTSSATINVPAATFTGALAASAQFDGTATPKPVYFNTAIATGTIDGAQTFTGTVTLTWCNLGDY